MHSPQSQCHCWWRRRFVLCAESFDFGVNGSYYINEIKMDGIGTHSWWNVNSALHPIQELSSLPRRLQVSLGSDQYGEENYALLAKWKQWLRAFAQQRS